MKKTNFHFNVLIVGLGKIGMEYDLNKDKKNFLLSHVNSFASHPNFNIVGVVDIDEKKCKEYKKIYNKNAFTSLNIALRTCNPDIVVISTPTDTLTKIFDLIIVNHTPKIILIEKPISLNFKEAKKIVEKALAKNIFLFVNYMRRSEPKANVIKTKIENLKTQFNGIVWYSSGIYNGASHFINLLEYWLGEYKAVKVINKGKLYKANDPEPEFEVEFKKGTFKFFPLINYQYFHNSIDMFYINGRIRYECNGKNVFIHNTKKDDVFTNYNILNSNPVELKADFSIIQSYVVNNLLLFLKGESHYLCSGEDALETLKIIEAIRKKIK